MQRPTMQPPQNINDIPEATVLSGPQVPPGNTSQQGSIPAAYTIARPVTNTLPPQPGYMHPYMHQQHQQQQQQQQLPQNVVIDETMLAEYMASNGGQVPPAPPDYMPLVICSCLCCWPISLLALFNSRQVRMFYARGQYMHAYLASRRAKSLALLSVFMGTILIVWYYMMMRRR